MVVLTDQLAGYVLRTLYFSQKAGQAYILNHTFNDVKSDVLIFGNSRAQHHYDTRILSDSLKMSCYNAGLDGGHSIIMQYAQIKIITNRYTPKIIILDFNPSNIVRFPGDYDRLSILLPYFGKYPDLQPFILLRGPFEKVKLLSAIYPFNSDIINIFRLNAVKLASRMKNFEGYVPIKNKVMNISMLKTKHNEEESTSIDSNMIMALKNIILLCKEKNISLYIINSPIYRTDFTENKLQTPEAKMSLEIILNNKVKFLDFANDTTFSKQHELFADNNHLNEKGATKYSQIISSVLKTQNVNKASYK